MSEAVVVAARIPLSRAGFEAWLATPLPAPSTLDWSRFYAGWWKASPPLPARRAGAPTVRAWLASRVAETKAGEPVVLLAHHADGVLLYYDGEMMGAAAGWLTQTLTVVRCAAPQVSAAGFAVYWSETSGLFYPDGVMAVCAIDRTDGAPFVDKAGLAKRKLTPAKLWASFAPIDQLYRRYLAELTAESSSPNARIAGDPRFVDPAIVAKPATATRTAGSRSR